MTLADLKRGQRGTVRAIGDADDLTMRLMEMGITPGCDVQMIGSAPLGDPLEFEVRGYRLSLRKSEATKVELEVPSGG